jgi:hypothetical protein
LVGSRSPEPSADGHFELVSRPKRELDDEAFATHDRAMAFYRDA